MSFPIEEIPNDSFVYRQVLPHERSGAKKRRVPNESHFELRENEEGLSVNWDKYITVEKNYILLALTQNQRTNKFLDHTAFKVFKYPVSLFHDIEQIDDVKHTPLYNGNPAPVGKPNNQSHSEVIYENDIEIFVKLSDYCKNDFENAYCAFEVNSINSKVEELKQLLDQTPYHRF